MSIRKSSWQLGVCSEVNEEYVSNPFPKRCECIEISVRIPSHAPVRGVWLRSLSDGLNFRVKMDASCRGKRFVYYHTEIEMAYYRLQYRFEIQTPEGYLYYTSAGCRTTVPPEDTDFVILANLRVPKWVPGSIFYQIFPDRFRNGNPEIGVAEGEYQFDGASTVSLSWNEDPLEYDDGRCLDFYNGDLAGIEQSISHFQQFSADALYLTPIFRARTNHKYDCIDYFHVDEHIGGDEALISLSRKLHEHNIRLMLDVSINHTGIEHPWFKRAEEDPHAPEADYYYRYSDGSYALWWDVPTLVQLNYASSSLREMIWEGNDALIMHYLNPPYQIDGWRFDVANEVGRNGRDQFCNEIWRGIREQIKQECPACYILGEHWEDSVEYLQGNQWDAAMNYIGSSRPIRSWLGELDRFLMDTWGHDPITTREWSADELAEAIEQHIRRIPNQLMFVQFNLIDSHDTPRLHHHDAVYTFSRYAGAVMLLFSLPGALSYFYGDEIGLAGHAGSMEGSRFPMQWDTAKWDLNHVNLYTALGKLRKDKRELFASGTFRILHAHKDLFVCARQLRNVALVTVISKAGKNRREVVDLSAIGAVEATLEIGDMSFSMDECRITLELGDARSAIFSCRCEL
jgi:alpha-glucosidase